MTNTNIEYRRSNRPTSKFIILYSYYIPIFDILRFKKFYRGLLRVKPVLYFIGCDQAPLRDPQPSSRLCRRILALCLLQWIVAHHYKGF